MENDILRANGLEINLDSRPTKKIGKALLIESNKNFGTRAQHLRTMAEIVFDYAQVPNKLLGNMNLRMAEKLAWGIVDKEKVNNVR